MCLDPARHGGYFIHVLGNTAILPSCSREILMSNANIPKKDVEHGTYFQSHHLCVTCVNGGLLVTLH